MLVLLDDKRLSPPFQKNGNFNIHRTFRSGPFRIKLLFDIPSCKRTNPFPNSALHVHQRNTMSHPIVHQHRWNSSGLSNTCIISSKSRCGMDNPRSILGGYKVPRNNLEGTGYAVHRLSPIEQRFIAFSAQVCSYDVSQYLMFWSIFSAKLLGKQ